MPCVGVVSAVLAAVAGVTTPGGRPPRTSGERPKPHGLTSGAACDLTYPSRSPQERNATRCEALAALSLPAAERPAVPPRPATTSTAAAGTRAIRLQSLNIPLYPSSLSSTPIRRWLVRRHSRLSWGIYATIARAAHCGSGKVSAMSTPPTPAPPKTPAKPPRFRPGWRWVAFFVALLALNYYTASRATQPQARVRVPYSPFFLQQVSAGHVTSITSKGTAIQGTFKSAESYAGSKKTTRFATEIPVFADTKALSQLLEKKGVVVNAEPITTALPAWENLLVGFLPTILFVGLLFWLMRRAGNVQGRAGPFGRARARREQPAGPKGTVAA